MDKKIVQSRKMYQEIGKMKIIKQLSEGLRKIKKNIIELNL